MAKAHPGCAGHQTESFWHSYKLRSGACRGLLHFEAMANNFDVQERTILSKTDNLATLYWQRKGSVTITAPPAHLLRLFKIHQHYHRYRPRHDYIPGKSNLLAKESSRLFHMNDSQFLTRLNSKFQQPLSF